MKLLQAAINYFVGSIFSFGLADIDFAADHLFCSPHTDIMVFICAFLKSHRVFSIIRDVIFSALFRFFTKIPIGFSIN